MLKRLISGSVFVAIIVGFFFLRELVDYRLFSILIWFLCAVGTFEVSRALRGKMHNSDVVLSRILGVIIIPTYCVLRYVLRSQYSITLSLCLILFFIVISLVLYLINQKGKNNLKESNLVAFLYPSVLLLCMIDCNSHKYGYFAMLLIFIVCPLTDTMAYLVGMIYNKIRKGKAKKLCPKLSPKKTIAGSIGGLIGGIIGGIVVYLIYNGANISALNHPFLFFLLVGLGASVLTQIGDLYESYIKRSVGLKDMGRIMPGHGGVLDRIDGIIFASAFIYAVFVFI